MEKKVLPAKKFDVKQWIDANGNEIEALEIDDFKGKFKVVFCYQSWCPGCHSSGFPSLVKMVEELKYKNDIVFFAIQTVFEGFKENPYEKIFEMQKKYNLKIPFGHDAGTEKKPGSSFMKNYQTGGTPWFVLIDKDDHIVFADFHLNVDAAIDYLKTV